MKYYKTSKYQAVTQYFDSEEKLNKHKIDKQSFMFILRQNLQQASNMNKHIKAHKINNNNGKDAAGSPFEVLVCQ
jgi:hypothetical protein